MPLNPYLVFNGNCREAVEFYARVFDTDKPIISTFAEGPENPEYPFPEEAKHLVLHAFILVDGSKLMFSDNFPGSPFTIGNNVTLAITNDNPENIRKWFDQLKEGGEVEMELQETFWSKHYGMVVDKFGVHWQLSHEPKDT